MCKHAAYTHSACVLVSVYKNIGKERASERQSKLKKHRFAASNRNVNDSFVHSSITAVLSELWRPITTQIRRIAFLNMHPSPTRQRFGLFIGILILSLKDILTLILIHNKIALFSLKLTFESTNIPKRHILFIYPVSSLY